MLKISLPISSRFMPYIVDLLKVTTLVMSMELLTANSIGSPVMSVFNVNLAQKLLFNFLAFSVFHLLVLRNVAVTFSDDKSE